MNRYADLTPADRMILTSYCSVLDGLSEYLGPGYEIVLHSLEDLDRSAIKVINGHYTGRTEGAPITDLALEMLAKIKKRGDKKNLVYFTRSKTGTLIRSATLPVSGEGGQIIGLICINFYMDMPLNTFLDSFLKLNGHEVDMAETFASSTDELILSSLESAKAAVFHDASIPSNNKNKEIISLLYARDIFNLKDAVVKVADNLGISKNTVYMHLRNLNAEQK